MFFLQAPLPSQASVPVHGLVALVSCCPDEMKTQNPGLLLSPHERQAALQSLLQQNPSEQVPLRHWLDEVQTEAVLLLQLPFPSQAWVPTQDTVASLSAWPEGTGLHFPSRPDRLQSRHVPVQAVSQQKPSEQNPVTHSLTA